MFRNVKLVDGVNTRYETGEASLRNTPKLMKPDSSYGFRRMKNTELLLRYFEKAEPKEVLKKPAVLYGIL